MKCYALSDTMDLKYEISSLLLEVNNDSKIIQCIILIIFEKILNIYLLKQFLNQLS